MRVPFVPIAALFAIAASIQPGLADPRPAVAELFTSQACSSCPPADILLGELAKRPDVVALAWHIDYWNQLGWRDRFTLTEATPRQQTYQRRLSLDEIYTPQMVVDGSHDVIGSERAAVLRALAAPRQGIGVKLGRDGDNLAISVGAGSSKGQLWLVAALADAATSVGGGENNGRHLQEYNIVRALRPLGDWTGSALTLRVPLASLPPEADRAAVLLQEPDQGPMLGAAMLALR